MAHDMNGAIRPRMNTNMLSERVLNAVQQPTGRLLVSLMGLTRAELVVIGRNNGACFEGRISKPELALLVFNAIKRLDRGPFHSATELQLISRGEKCGLCRDRDAVFLFRRCRHYGICVGCRDRLIREAGPPFGLITCPIPNCGFEHEACDLWQLTFINDNHPGQAAFPQAAAALPAAAAALPAAAATLPPHSLLLTPAFMLLLGFLPLPPDLLPSPPVLLLRKGMKVLISTVLGGNQEAE